MIRRLFLLLLLTSPAFAQFTAVTGTVAGIQGGSYTIDFVNLSGQPQLPLLGGISQFPQQIVGTANSFGTINVSLADNNQILPLPSQWKFSFTFNPCSGVVQGFSFQTTITGASQDISTLISSNFPPPPSGCSGSGSGGGVIASPQFQIPYYNFPGTVAAIKGDTVAKTDGAGNVLFNSIVSPVAASGPNVGLPYGRLGIAGNANLSTINFMQCSATGTGCSGQMEPYFWSTGYTQRAPNALGQNAFYAANNIVYNAYSGGTNNNIDGSNDGTQGFGPFINFLAHQTTFNQYTPGQGGGIEVQNIFQRAAGDSVAHTQIQQCWAANRGQDESCEGDQGVARSFQSFLNPNSGGTLTYSGTPTAEGHYNVSMAAFGQYNVINIGEQNYMMDVTKRVQQGNQVTSARASWDVNNNFVQLTVDASLGLSNTSHTQLTAVANGHVYTGCPSTDTGQKYPLVSSAPYGDAGVGSGDGGVTLPDGTGLKGVNENYDSSSGSLLGYCFTVASTAPGGMTALSAGNLVFIAGGEFNGEYTKVINVVDGTHFTAFVHHNHRVGETVAWGAAIGQGVGYNADERPPGYSNSNQNSQTTVMRLIYPIMSVDSATQVTVYPIAEATGTGLPTLGYLSNTPKAPLTMTPTITTGVLTSITPTTAGNYTVNPPFLVSGNGRLHPPNLSYVSTSATTIITTFFDEYGTNVNLVGTTPMVCQNGCTGTWGGTAPFSYAYGGGAQSTQQIVTPITLDTIQTGRTNENVQVHLGAVSSPITFGSSFNLVGVRYVDANNFLVLFIGTDTFGTSLFDVVGGTLTQIGSTLPLGSTGIGDYTITLNGSAVTVYAPNGGVISGTTANLTGTKVGFGLKNGNNVIFSSLVVTSLNGTCNVPPVIQFQQVNFANNPGYQPKLVSGGSSCPSDLALLQEPIQNRIYTAPVAIINKAMDPAHLPTTANPNVQPDGTFQLQTLNTSLWTNGDEIQETILPGRFVEHNEAHIWDPLVSLAARNGPPEIVSFAWPQNGQPIHNWINSTPSTAYYGDFAHNWTPVSGDQSRMVSPNPILNFQGVLGPITFNFPPFGGFGQAVGADPTAPSIGGAMLNVTCNVVVGAPNIDHPCLHGQNIVYDVFDNNSGTLTHLALDTSNGLMSYDHTFQAATVQGGNVAVDHPDKVHQEVLEALANGPPSTAQFLNLEYVTPFGAVTHATNGVFAAGTVYGPTTFVGAPPPIPANGGTTAPGAVVYTYTMYTVTANGYSAPTGSIVFNSVTPLNSTNFNFVNPSDDMPGALGYIFCRTSSTGGLSPGIIQTITEPRVTFKDTGQATTGACPAGDNSGVLTVDGPATFNGAGSSSVSTGTASNTDLAGLLTLSGGTQTYSFVNTYVSAPVCVATDTTAANAVRASASTSTLTITGTGTDVVAYICIGRN